LLKARVLREAPLWGAGVLARRSPGPLREAGAGDREDAVGERVAPKLKCAHIEKERYGSGDAVSQETR